MPIHFSHGTTFRDLQYTQKEISDITYLIDQVRNFHGCIVNNENFSSIYRNFYRLIDQIPTPTLAIDVNYLIRSRPNDGIRIFTKETEISYNSTNKDAIKKGRFNRPRESMFYGCAPGESSSENNFLITSCLESYKEILNNANREPFKYFTVGKFFVKEPFFVVNLCLNDFLLRVNPKMKARTEDFIEQINTAFPGLADHQINIWRFLTDLAAKPEEIASDHFLTTAYWCAVWKYCQTVLNTKANGILYPSPITKNEGINVVLQPETVDQYLRLKSVFMVKFERDSYDPKQFRIFQCSKEVPVINGVFEIAIDHEASF